MPILSIKVVMQLDRAVKLIRTMEVGPERGQRIACQSLHLAVFATDMKTWDIQAPRLHGTALNALRVIPPCSRHN